ncbi:hypothetical protein [Candidatus Odyssella acanthamoebae]|uniref:Uncharacterized protein n=1 Tax=Candidatus Odyssella acanthamoebae TaxID=91604 RepID=A0A077AWC3_9PROT|nr:hypothetical protein [Candidatus Paracaedibacter acanthamoebae]AIK96344.1 hypothetical protein ID47_05750 [Candidatus Paracaedibacter acanthamoebae]
MVKTKNIVKGFIALICVNGLILASEQTREREVSSLSQMLTMDPQTLTEGFGVETFFTAKKKPANTHELKIAKDAYNQAKKDLYEGEGEKALGLVGLSLYLGYPKIIDIIYTIGFRKNHFEGFSSKIEGEIQKRFLKICEENKIVGPYYLASLRSKYKEKWSENKLHLIGKTKPQQKIEAKSQGWLETIVQKVWSHPETVLPLKIEETVAPSEKEVRKRSRSQESTAAPHLKSRQRKVADAEKQPLLQAGEPEEFRISNSERQPSSTSVRQRKPASPTKQPLPATDETRGPLTSEAKKRN